MTLKLTNNVDKTVYQFTGLTDENTSRLNYIISLTLPNNMADGEYTYTLYSNLGNELAQGLCQIGDYTPNKTIYTGQTKNNYIQYKG